MERITPRRSKRFSRFTVGWSIYAIGWLVWFGALPLKADYAIINPWGVNPFPIPSTSNLTPEPTIGALVGGGALQPKYLVLAGHLYLVYYLGFLFSIIWFLIRLGPWWLRLIGRIGSLGMLAVWVEVAYASQHYNFLALPGYPVLAVGSTLICLGVWLIPPRQKREGLVALGPASPSQAVPASGIGGG